jgi:hypothetical protein
MFNENFHPQGTLTKQPQAAQVESSSLPYRIRLLDMQRAGKELVSCYAKLAQSKRNFLQEVIGDEIFTQWEHYPAPEEIVRHDSRHYFYHAHSTDDREDAEHGHFHVFVRLKNLRIKSQPWIEQGISFSLPGEETRAPQLPDPLVHLIGISVDHQGVPFRLFTTSQWVTNETWCPASEVIRLLHTYRNDRNAEQAIVPCWISAMLRLFQPQIAKLLVDRDVTVKRWARRQRGRTPAIHDRRLEICSSMHIWPDRQIAALDSK